MRINGPFIELYKMKKSYIILFLLIFTIISGLEVVYVKHKTRMLHIQLQTKYVNCSNLNTEWSKLLLEKSTWLSDFRVEQLAKNKLNMINPEQVYIIRQ